MITIDKAELQDNWIELGVGIELPNGDKVTLYSRDGFFVCIPINNNPPLLTRTTIHPSMLNEAQRIEITEYLTGEANFINLGDIGNRDLFMYGVPYIQPFEEIKIRPTFYEQVEREVIYLYNIIGIDRPCNHDRLVTAIADDIEETAGEDWTSNDVCIAFRRQLETLYEEPEMITLSQLQEESPHK